MQGKFEYIGKNPVLAIGAALILFFIIVPLFILPIAFLGVTFFVVMFAVMAILLVGIIPLHFILRLCGRRGIYRTRRTDGTRTIDVWRLDQRSFERR